MTPAQLQLLLAMARLLKNIAANPLASVGTNEITEALRAVEAEDWARYRAAENNAGFKAL